ncbi:MAG: arsenate reductase family protein, partial [Alphaproteobacteria bacterium]|nr:arsenate reductase family protein [Alphaproteobacteria bacterium]
MTTVLFWEKPGCVNNTRQKALLRAAGHEVVARDLLAEPWTPDTLLPFLESRPVAEWFNRASPRVKSGAVIPEAMSAEAALAALCDDPLLIRRPLMRALGRSQAGFDDTGWLGLPEGGPEACPRRDMPPCP